MARTTDTDYQEIKKYYMLHPTVPNHKIAKKFNVTPNALNIQISRHNWKAERDEYYGDMEADFREAAKARDLIERDELDARLKKNNRLALEQVEAHLSAMGIGTDEDGKPTIIREGIPIKDLKALVEIQKMVHESEYRRLNVPMPKQPIEVTPTILAPADVTELPAIDFDIEEKIKTVRYVELPELPETEDNGGNGNDTNSN